MKKTFIVSLLYAALCSTSLEAQTVTDIKVSASPSSYADSCPVRITFKAVIYSKGTGSFKYKWLRSDGAVDTYDHFVTLSGTGVDEVSTTWDLGTAGMNYSGWQALKIISPVVYESERAPFKIKCSGGSKVSHLWKLTPCAEALLRSYRKLVSGIGIRDCPDRGVDVFSIDGTMPLRGYGYSTDGGNISFASFYYNLTGVNGNHFRNIWGPGDLNFNHYGVCTPSPLNFPVTLGPNDLYKSRLIPKSDYESYVGPYVFLLMEHIRSIRPVDIASIGTIYMSDTRDFSATHDASNYNNVYSCAGLQAKVKLRTGEEVLCYLINNYDATGTILWKQANTTGVQYVFPAE